VHCCRRLGQDPMKEGEGGCACVLDRCAGGIGQVKDMFRWHGIGEDRADTLHEGGAVLYSPEYYEVLYCTPTQSKVVVLGVLVVVQYRNSLTDRDLLWTVDGLNRSLLLPLQFGGSFWVSPLPVSLSLSLSLSLSTSSPSSCLPACL